MRIDVLRNELEKYLKNKYNFEPLIEEKDDSIIVKCSIKFRDFDDEVLLRISAFTSGESTISFIFDKIELTLEVMLRINAFNENVNWLKAFINENGYLTFKYPIIDAVIESNVVDAIEFLFKIITNENTRKHLDPLTVLTFNDNQSEETTQPGNTLL